MAISPKEFKIRAEAGFKSLSYKRRPTALQELQEGTIKGLNYYNKNSSKEVKKVAKSPDYKPKYKSLSKKDKQEAKYISKTTPSQRQFNRVAGDVLSTVVAPLGALKVLPKATRVVKELATKFTQAKKTLPNAGQVAKPLNRAEKNIYKGLNERHNTINQEGVSKSALEKEARELYKAGKEWDLKKGLEKTKLNNLNNKVHAKLDSAKRLQEAAMNKAMEKSYRPKFEKPTQEMIDKAGPVKIIKPRKK